MGCGASKQTEVKDDGGGGGGTSASVVAVSRHGVSANDVDITVGVKDLADLWPCPRHQRSSGRKLLRKTQQAASIANRKQLLQHVVDAIHAGDVDAVLRVPEQKAMTRLFTSSTFVDTKDWRNCLMQDVFPFLSQLCAMLGLSFNVIDMRWGVRSSTGNNHGTSALCMAEIARCLRGSVGPAFVTFLGDRYGFRPFPAKINASELDAMLKWLEQSSEEADNNAVRVLRQWFLLDQNCSPPAYILQPVDTIIPDYTSHDRDKQRAAGAKWWPLFEQMQLALRRASKALPHQDHVHAHGHGTAEESTGSHGSAGDGVGESEGQTRLSPRLKYEMSVTHEEVINGILHNEDRRTQALAILRSLEFDWDSYNYKADTRHGPTIKGFADWTDKGTLDKDAFERQRKLKEDVAVAGLLPTHVHKYTVPMDQQLAGLDDAAYCQHLRTFADRTCAALAEMIVQGVIDTQVALGQETTEVCSQWRLCLRKAGALLARHAEVEAIVKHALGDNSFVRPAAGVRANAFKGRIFQHTDGQTDDADGREATDESDGDTNAKEATGGDADHGKSGDGGDGAGDEEEHSTCISRTSSISSAGGGGHGTTGRTTFHPLVVYGKSGCGKTTLMAAAAVETARACVRSSRRSGGKQPVVIARLLGTSASTADARSVMASVLEQLACMSSDLRNVLASRCATIAPSVRLLPFKQLSKLFHDMLIMFALDTAPLILFLDSLDQLSDADDGRELAWLPMRWSSSDLRIIVSTLPDVGPCLASLRAGIPAATGTGDRKDGAPFWLDVQPFAVDDLPLVLSAWEEQCGLSFIPAHRDRLLSAFRAQPVPLYMRLAFDYARRNWHSYTDEHAPVLSVPPTVTRLINALFDELEAQHGALLVRHACVYMGCAGDAGLSPQELEDLLSCDDEVLDSVYEWWVPPFRRLPPSLWARVQNDFGDYLVERGHAGTVVYSWYHRQFWECVHTRYLADANLTPFHRRISDYFGNKYANGVQYNHVLHNRHVTPQPLYLLGVGEDGDSSAPARASSTDTQKQQQQQQQPTPNLRRLTHQIRHQVEARDVRGLLRETLGNFAFLVAKAQHALLFDSLRDDCVACRQLLFSIKNAAAKSSNSNDNDNDNDNDDRGCIGSTEEQATLAVFVEFILANVHLLRRFPGKSSIVQLALQRDASDPVHKAARAYVDWCHTGNSSGRDGGESEADDRTAEDEGACEHGQARDAFEAVADEDDRRTQAATLPVLCEWLNRPKVQDPCLVTLRDDSPEGLMYAVLRRNQRQLLCCGRAHVALVCDLPSQTLVGRLKGHSSSIKMIEEHPSKDVAVTASHDHTARLWDLTTMECMHTLHIDGMCLLARFSAAGDRVMTGSFTEQLLVWDAASGEQLKNLVGHRGQIDDGHWVLEDRGIVTVSEDGMLLVWDVDEGKARTGKSVVPNSHSIVACDVYRPNNTVVTIDRSQIVWLVNYDTLERVWKGRGAPESTCIRFNHDASLIVTVGSLRTRVLDGKTGSCVFKASDHTALMCRARFLPSGLLATFSEDRRAHLYNVAEKKKVAHLIGHGAGVADGLAYGENQLITIGRDGDVRCWDIQRALDTFIKDSSQYRHSNLIFQIAMSPCGRYVGTASQDSSVIVWDANTGDAIARASPKKVKRSLESFKACCFSASGEYFLAIAEKTVFVFEMTTLEVISTAAVSMCTQMWFNADCTILATSSSWFANVNLFTLSSEGQLKELYDIGTLAFAFHATIPNRFLFLDNAKKEVVVEDVTLPSPGEEVTTKTVVSMDVMPAGKGNGAAWSQDGRTAVITTEMEAGVLLLDMEKQCQLHAIQLEDTLVWKPLLTCDGGVCITTSPHGQVAVRAFDVAGGKLLYSHMLDGGESFNSALSHDESMLAVAGTDHSLRILDVRTGQLLTCLTLHVDRVMCVAWHPTKHVLASGGADSEFKLVRVGR
ncbi:hypothetical protein PTSG_00205 [Salpingoeca rosetta]|uniref:AAA+ ATPase domain-containing protein n=1 Tax=Salpingoeca rosetta (strain ATCC 50818 / BSB-021) TaxID=946362 RepID=F2TVT6_SALR5|nr:uncharacterized protein PTSG_00205 [Salpingoeca rosetta]EGD72182.1 hypothetical protein PTSG_00205 [Salpingoeca rosetta]|eukprot:XP_004998754.1 hypothetical protein PTSG_00205 [Salpingoeca rosetta]